MRDQILQTAAVLTALGVIVAAVVAVGKLLRRLAALVLLVEELRDLLRGDPRAGVLPLPERLTAMESTQEQHWQALTNHVARHPGATKGEPWWGNR